MSSTEKLKERLLQRPKDFTYEEARSLLRKCGYVEHNRGKTSGSAVKFYHETTKAVFYLHRPHPSNTMLLCYIDELIAFLKGNGEL